MSETDLIIMWNNTEITMKNDTASKYLQEKISFNEAENIYNKQLFSTSRKIEFEMQFFIKVVHINCGCLYKSTWDITNRHFYRFIFF